MFENIQNNNNYRTQSNPWEDIFDFLCSLIKGSLSLKEEIDFQDENRRILANFDLLTIVRRIGRTEERYENEIKICKEIVAAINYINPPTPSPQSISPLSPKMQQLLLQSDTSDLAIYYKELLELTENMPYYVVIKSGKKGIDWMLDKFGPKVKERFYEVQR